MIGENTVCKASGYPVCIDCFFRKKQEFLKIQTDQSAEKTVVF